MRSCGGGGHVPHVPCETQQCAIAFWRTRRFKSGAAVSPGVGVAGWGACCSTWRSKSKRLSTLQRRSGGGYWCAGAAWYARRLGTGYSYALIPSCGCALCKPPGVTGGGCVRSKQTAAGSCRKPCSARHCSRAAGIRGCVLICDGACARRSAAWRGVQAQQLAESMRRACGSFYSQVRRRLGEQSRRRRDERLRRGPNEQWLRRNSSRLAAGNLSRRIHTLIHTQIGLEHV